MSDDFPYYRLYFPAKAFLALFPWIPDTVNFALLVAECFYILIDLLELCFGMRVIFLETV